MFKVSQNLFAIILTSDENTWILYDYESSLIKRQPQACSLVPNDTKDYSFSSYSFFSVLK